MTLNEKYKAVRLISPQSLTANTVGTDIDCEVYNDDAMVVLTLGALSGSDLTVDVSIIGERNRGTNHAEAIKATAEFTVVNKNLMSVAAIAATGTITIVDFSELSGKTVTVDGQVLTEGAEFTAAVSNDSTATSLASAINGLENVNASAAANIITIVAAAAGTAGNALTVATNGASTGIVLSGATLAGGAAAVHASITINDKTYVEGSDFNVDSTNALTATAIKTAINADKPTGVDTVVSSGANLFFVAITAGTAANAYVTTSDNAGITTPEATFTGGAAEVVGVTATTLGTFTQATVTDTNTIAAIQCNIFDYESIRAEIVIGGYDTPTAEVSVVALLQSPIGSSTLNSSTLS